MLVAVGRSAESAGATNGAITIIANRRAVSGCFNNRVIIVVLVDCILRAVGGLACRCGGSRRRYGSRPFSAVASVRKLVIMEAAGQLGLLKMCCNVLVRHFLHACLKEIVFLFLRPRSVPTSG